MADPGRTWLVLVRDVSESVRVTGEDSVVAALVLHAESGLILGVSSSDTATEALAGAFESALTTQAADLPPAPPARVVCVSEYAAEVRKAMAAAPLGSAELIEAGVVPEAEDLFDGLLGHLIGRTQPVDLPMSQDWALLVAQTQAFLSAEPWARWSDEVQSWLQVTIGGTFAEYLAIVMGNAGVQLGLALYPVEGLPSGAGSSSKLMPWEGSPEDIPSGTLLLFLDERGESAEDFAAKARRYGWPSDSAYFPAWVCVGPDGPGDLSGLQAQRLQVALAAVLAMDSRGPVLDGAAEATTGRVALASGDLADFVITQRSPLA